MKTLSSGHEGPAKRRLSRRAFLKLGLLAGIGTGIAVLDRITQPAGAFNYLRWAARGQVRGLFGAPSVVALGQCNTYQDDVGACLEALWDQADMPGVEGKRVLVKPNLVDFVEGHPVTTAPEVVSEVVDLLIRRGAAEVAVGDGSAFRHDTCSIARASGLAAALKSRKVPFVDLNFDDPAPVPVPGGWFANERELWLPRHVREADYIVSVPKMKTHHWADVSLSMKNLFGVIPGAYYGWPKNVLHVNGINASILGLYETLPRVLAVVDGVVGMQGDGPLFGTAVKHGMIAVGADPVAVDTTCVRAMGLEGIANGHLALAGWAGIGQTNRIVLRGTPLAELVRRYEPPPREG